MKYKFKKILGSALIMAMTASVAAPVLSTNVYADATGKSYLSLGADLTDDELDTVLGQLDIDEDDLDDYDVVYITNDEEYQYLGAYVDSSKIGDRALSSVLIENASEGSGIDVTTSDYITYCTPGMYENALATAGVDDVCVYVAGPFEVSGTAALVGAIKAYSEMTGTSVSDSTIDAAVDEIVTTGDLEQNTDADSDSVEGLIAYLKEQIANGNIDTDPSDEEIENAADKFNISLTSEQIEQIRKLISKIGSLNLDYNSILSQAQSVYNKLKDAGINIDLSNVDTQQASNLLQQLIDFILGILKID